MAVGVRAYVEAALGKRPLTLLIRGAKLVNVNTGETYPASIGSYGDRIVYVGPGGRAPPAEEVINARGAYALPGFIDTHLHVESTMLTPARFAEAVIPHGTTTAFADPHEIANVLGKDGVRMMVENAKGLPMKLYFLAPTCVPESPAVTSGAEISPADVAEMVSWEGVAGLGEVMDFDAVLAMTPKMEEILEIGRRLGLLIDGHSPLLSGRELSGYMAAGPDSDHENFTVESMLEKLRAGMYVKLRPPYVANTRKFVAALKELPMPWNVILVTDDVMPDNLERLGHLDYSCRSFIEAGMDPIEAIRSCTLRPAQHVRMPQLGALSPGKAADVVLVDDLKRLRVQAVVSDGVLVARGGKMLSRWAPRPFGRRALDTMKTGTLGPDDFVVKPPVADGALTVNAIDFGLVRSPKDPAEAFMESVLTTLTRAEVRAEGGLLKLDDLAVVLVFDRHRGVKRRSFGFARNLMKRGAIASSVAHDGHNLVVMGKDQRDMQAAAEMVTKGKGGIAAVDSKPLAFVDLPVAGLMSEEGLGEVSKKMRGLRSAFKKMGVIDHPYMPVVALLTLSVIPHARITDKGVYDVDGRRFVEPFVPGENP